MQLKQWVAKAVASKVKHNVSAAGFQSLVELFRSTESISQEFRDALPGTFKKAMAYLDSEFGSDAFVYDICEGCETVFRCKIQDDEFCPRCCKPRYHGAGSEKRARARLVYNPLAGFIRFLWGEPNLARWARLQLSQSTCYISLRQRQQFHMAIESHT